MGFWELIYGRFGVDPSGLLLRNLIPGRPVACNCGLLSIKYGLLLARAVDLLGFPCLNYRNMDM